MKPISLLVPSRGRPQGFSDMLESALATANTPIEVVLVLDEDDPTYPEYGDENGVLPVLVRKVRIPRGLMSENWNIAYQHARGDILMHAADDIRFRTEDWDGIVREAFASVPDCIAFVHGADGSPNSPDFTNMAFGTHGFIHRRWCETVGYFVPPYFVSDMNDTWLNEVANALGRRITVDIMTEHLHPDLGTGPEDVTHQERRQRHAEQDPNTLYRELAKERQADIDKLATAMR